MSDQLEITAKQLFDSLGGPGCKADWNKQPEHLKDVWRLKATPSETGSKIEYHYGANIVWLIRQDGTAHIYTPMTGRHAVKRDWDIMQYKRDYLAKIQNEAVDKHIL